MISKNTKPLISIITVVKNNEKYLEETIQSVINQNFKNFEYIIIDGKSTDGTIEIIKKYNSIIDCWISENDKGIYDAFNKGLEIAKGNLIGFVNSDDVLTPNALKILNNYYIKYPKSDFFFGSVKKHWKTLHGYKPWKIHFTWGFYTSHSTGFFIKKNAAKIVGKYNLNYKYSADYDYFYRMIVKHKLTGVATKKSELFGVFRRGGYSSTIKFIDHFFETIKIRVNNKQNKLLVLIIFIIKYLKNIKKF
ncbi:glycosyltransferase [Candidatus Pelagibacter sp.]|nr:glycosyltransferase [Candidatus Pelagibacter sp.]